MVCAVRDGRIVGGREYETRAEALEAVGLSGQDAKPMMRAEVEMLRAGYEALNRWDLDAAFRLTHSDFEWTTDDRLLNAGTYRGREEITRLLVDQRKPFDEVLQVPEEFFQQGNQVVVFVKLRSRPKGSSSSQRATLRTFGHFETGRRHAPRRMRSVRRLSTLWG